MYDPVFTMGLTPFHASWDYPAYADGELAPHMGSAREYQQVLKKLFALEGRIDMGQFRRHDLEAAVFAQTDEDHDGRFRGSFYLRISCHSLDEELDDMAQRLLTLGRSVSQRLVNVNMTVGIEQSASGWDLYFAGLNIDPTHDDTEQKLRRRAEYLYLSKVGWANIISPAVSRILPQSAEPPFEALENGAVSGDAARSLGVGPRLPLPPLALGKHRRPRRRAPCAERSNHIYAKRQGRYGLPAETCKLY